MRYEVVHHLVLLMALLREPVSVSISLFLTDVVRGQDWRDQNQTTPLFCHSRPKYKSQTPSMLEPVARCDEMTSKL